MFFALRADVKVTSDVSTFFISKFKVAESQGDSWDGWGGALAQLPSFTPPLFIAPGPPSPRSASEVPYCNVCSQIECFWRHCYCTLKPVSVTLSSCTKIFFRSQNFEILSVLFYLPFTPVPPPTLSHTFTHTGGTKYHAFRFFVTFSKSGQLS